MSPAAPRPAPEAPAGVSYVVVEIAGRSYGLPIEVLRDVFVPRAMTPVPLAPSGVAGLLNLRGRVVTAIDLRVRLGLPAAAAGAERVALGLERGGDAYALLADAVGDVLTLGPETYEPAPPQAEGRAAVQGAHRLPKGLLLVLDLDQVMDFGAGSQPSARGRGLG